jgi:hypothetical protein
MDSPKAEEPRRHCGYKDTLIAFFQTPLWEAQQNDCEHDPGKGAT